jgi:hypothetical protein
MSNAMENYFQESDTAVLKDVIITRITRRGDGKDNPIRVITEVWTTEGQKIAEYDPCIISTESKIHT